MSYWLTDPQLFLYAKGTGSDDVHLWRCKKPASSSSSLVVPLKPDDFDHVKTVTDYMELLANTVDWDETDYKRLVKYIFERRLLVNGQGFVIAELHKVDEDGNKIDDDANEEVSAIYIRSLDVLALKPYIPKLRERPIPLRRVQVMEDVDGKPALMEKDFTIVTKLTARVDHLEAENNRLKFQNKTLEGEVTKLTADLVTQMNTLTTFQEEVKNARKEAIWKNDLINSDWVGIEKLTAGSHPHPKMTIIKPKGYFTIDDNSTNVRASSWFTLKVEVNNREFKAVSLEDLTPNKENARFLQSYWSIEAQGKTYIIKEL